MCDFLSLSIRCSYVYIFTTKRWNEYKWWRRRRRRRSEKEEKRKNGDCTKEIDWDFCPLHTDTLRIFHIRSLCFFFITAICTPHIYACCAMVGVIKALYTILFLFMCYTRLFQSEGERQFSNSKLIPCWSPLKYIFHE